MSVTHHRSASVEFISDFGAVVAFRLDKQPTLGFALKGFNNTRVSEVVHLASSFI